MEECERLIQDNQRRSVGPAKKRAKSVYQYKNLRAIENRKKEKMQESPKDNTWEVILRILRMRYALFGPSLNVWDSCVDQLLF